MWYEVIYENGEHSIAFYEDDDEALSAIGEHVRRAKAGLQGQAANSLQRADLEPDETRIPVNQQRWAAQRVVKVFKYDEHPVDYSEKAQTLSEDVAAKTVADCIKEVASSGGDGVVDLKELCAAILETTESRLDSGPHESNYKMKEISELKLGGK